MAQRKAVDAYKGKTMSRPKLLFLDLETTGLNPQKHAIIQIAAIVQTGTEIQKRFQVRVRPDNENQIDPRTMEFHGFGVEEFERKNNDGSSLYLHAGDAHNLFLLFMKQYVDPYNKTDKFILIGYNLPNFDWPFLKTFFERCADKYIMSWFHFPPLDVMQLAGFALANKRAEMENFKLVTVAKTLGISVDEAKLHGAAYDTEITRQVAVQSIAILTSGKNYE